MYTEELVPILRVSGKSKGSYSTIYPNGTHAAALHHEHESVDPINHVDAELIPELKALEVQRRGSISFSDTLNYYRWLKAE